MQHKITPQLIDVWATILRKTKDSRLFLMNTAMRSKHGVKGSDPFNCTYCIPYQMFQSTLTLLVSCAEQKQCEALT